MNRPRPWMFSAAVVAGLAFGCSTADPTSVGAAAGGGSGNSPPGPNVGQPPGPSPVTEACAADSFAAPLQMLNEFELKNTLTALLGEASVEVLIPTGARGSYRGGLLIEQLPSRWEETAWRAAGEAVKKVEALTGCSPANQNDTCAHEFVGRLGRRAYRRPLDASEMAKLVALYDSAKSEGFAAGIEIVVAAVLQHPSLLYRIEAGVPDSIQGDRALRRLNGYEVAQRLSYNFWGSPPDDVLFAAAEAGELSTPQGVRAQAERLLADERATAMFGDFVGQWLFTDHLGAVPKNAARYPRYTAEVPGLLKQELQLFVQNLVRSSGDLNALFTADYGFVNNKLAAFYGVPGVFGDQLVRTTLPPEAQRAGLLTFAGLLSTEGTVQGVSLSAASRTYPIGRGRFIRQRLSCEGVPPPIANATMLPGVPEKIDALNQRFGGADDTPPRAFFQEVTSSNPVCKSCHTMLEPLGFLLERYGADGLPRKLDIDGQPVIETGSYSANGDFNPDLVRDYASPAELGRALAASPGVKTCLMDHWLQYSLGRALGPSDKPCFGGSNTPVPSTPLKQIYLDVVSSDIYRVRKVD